MLATLLVLSFFFLAIPVRADIYINEISPSTDPEWVELYNDGDPIDLEGWRLEDNNSSTTDDLTLTGIINLGEHLVFSRSSGWLNNAGDIVFLYNNASPSAQIVDQHEYGSISADKSIARVPDGADSWDVISPTQESSNPSPEPSPTPTPTPTNTPTATPQPSEADPPRADSPIASPSPTPNPSSSLDSRKEEGTVAGLTVDSIHLTPVRSSSPSPSPNLKGQALEGPALNIVRARTALLVGFGLITISVAGFLGYQKYKSLNQL